MIAETSEPIVEVLGLSRYYGRKVALDGVSLCVPRGVVFGLVGENGAGKTTLIKHLLGLLRARSGTVRVFGLDPVIEPVRVLSRLGYLSEDRDLPDWLRLHEMMRYLRAFYPTWDDGYAEELRRQFDLDPRARIKTLSQGQRARAGLMAALAFRPELLVLDEPSTGLDPIVRKEILSAIIRTIAQEGRTVLFSSHLLDEVERVSDHVALIDRGRIVLGGSLDSIKALHHRLTVRFDQPLARPPALLGWERWEGFGREWTIVCPGSIDEIRARAAGFGAQVVEDESPSLEDIFVARAALAQPAAMEGP
jgi:ABC-2 type transport system ATP-binding protein